MAYVPLKLPPGVYRPGTAYDSAGRWYATNLVRWHAGAMQAIGGWEPLGVTGGAQVDVSGRPCGMAAWRANDSAAQLAIGTHTSLYHFASGVLTDITPTGFVAGGADAVLASATYGNGAYGGGVYGTGDPSQSTLIEAQSWSLDAFGEDLVACAPSDGKLYYWDTSAGGDAALIHASAPVDCLGVVVTPERFVVALGAGGDGRLVQWSDQQSTSVWTPASDNQAGDFTLAGSGQIMAARRSQSETLIWTESDLWSMAFIGGDLVYSFQQRGTSCGALSRRSMAVVDSQAAWMGARSFYLYDGYAKPLPCDVGDYVFSDLNRTQASKIWADVRGEYSEVTWYYPSAGATECDRYVTYNYAAGFWSIGELSRTAGVDRGAFGSPILCDADGLAYSHEIGSDYDDLTPYAESGPLEIGSGDNVAHVSQIIPDERTLGGVEVSLLGAMYPTATETTYGPYDMANPTSVRATARQFRVRADQASAGWRLGTLRLDVKQGGKR